MKSIFNTLSLAMEGSWGHPPSPNKSQDAQSSGRDEKTCLGWIKQRRRPGVIPAAAPAVLYKEFSPLSCLG